MMDKSIKNLTFIMLLIVVIASLLMLPVLAEGQSSPLITNENPLDGERVTITFIDESDNIIHIERLVKGQAFKIMTREGELHREFLSRQNAIITLPELQEGDGWIPLAWMVYFRIGDFHLRPLYMIELDVFAHGEEYEYSHVVQLTAQQGHRIRVLDVEGVEIYSNEYSIPSSIVLPDIELPSGYALSHWELENTEHYSLFIPQIIPIIFFYDESGELLFQAELPNGSRVIIQNIEGETISALDVDGSQSITMPAGSWEGQYIDDLQYIVRQTGGVGLAIGDGGFQLSTEIIIIAAVLVAVLLVILMVLRKPKKRHKKKSNYRAANNRQRKKRTRR